MVLIPVVPEVMAKLFTSPGGQEVIPPVMSPLSDSLLMSSFVTTGILV